ncbi:MAG: uroporphyrinogen-III synthase [bacterium]
MVPQSRAPVILLTRPAPQSEQFAAAVRVRFPDCPVVLSPLLAPVYFAPPIPPRDWTAVIFTSRTAVQSVERNAAYGAALPKLAFCVGNGTAQAATELGLHAISADGTSEDLLTLIRDHAPGGPLLYLHGREMREDLAEMLNSAGIETVSLTTYAQEAVALSPEAILTLHSGAPVIAPIFSPRTGAILARQLPHPPSGLTLCIVAISSAVDGIAGAEMVVARQPTADAVLNAIANKLQSLCEP